jgi:hypothetical protein
MVRFLYAMPNATGSKVRNMACNDHSARFLLRPGYSWYAGVITTSIFEEVKKIVSQFDVLLGVETMAKDIVELASVLDELGMGDTKHTTMTTDKRLNKNHLNTGKRENQEVLRMLKQTNVWDIQLYAYLLQLKASSKGQKVAKQRL